MDLKTAAAKYRRLTRSVLRGLTAPEKQLYARGVLDAGRLTLPDFLCIGAQKAGTSWLFRNCRPHPEIFVGRKELHYFDQNFHWSLRAYAAHFAPGRERIKGEFTPAYSILDDEKIRFISRIMPDLRLILLLRHPVSRAWSQALMELVHRHQRPFENVSEAEFLEHFRSPLSVSRGDYAAMLDRWTRYFPEEQILLGFQEEMAGAPQVLMERVFRHLGVSTEVDWNGFELYAVRGKGPGIPLPDRYREILEEIYAEPLERVSARLGGKVSHWRPMGPGETVQAVPAWEPSAQGNREKRCILRAERASEREKGGKPVSHAKGGSSSARRASEPLR